MKCLALQSFAGLNYSAAKGKEIDLPLHEAKSLEHAGIVRILDATPPEMAYETAEAAQKGKQAAYFKGKKK